MTFQMRYLLVSSNVICVVEGNDGVAESLWCLDLCNKKRQEIMQVSQADFIVRMVTTREEFGERASYNLSNELLVICCPTENLQHWKYLLYLIISFCAVQETQLMIILLRGQFVYFLQSY